MRQVLGTCFFLAVMAVLAMNVVNQKSTLAQPTAASKKVLRHVVLFKFKANTSKDQIAAIEAAFRGLPDKIDAIRDFEWGTDVSPEGKSKGFTHCFFVTFADEKGRDAYLPHPAHQEFVQIVRAHVEDVCVVDYWTQK